MRFIVLLLSCVILFMTQSCAEEQSKLQDNSVSQEENSSFPGQEEDTDDATSEGTEEELSEESENNSDNLADSSGTKSEKPAYIRPKFKHLPQKYWDSGLQLWKLLDD